MEDMEETVERTAAETETEKEKERRAAVASAAARPAPRLIAFAADMLFIHMILGLAKGLVIGFGGDDEVSALLYEGLVFHWSFFDIFKALAVAAYFAVSTAVWGCTLGKLLLNLRVVTVDGRWPRIPAIIYRETVGRFLSSVCYLGYLPVIYTEQRAALHDWLCDTRVVAVDPAGGKSFRGASEGPEKLAGKAAPIGVAAAAALNCAGPDSLSGAESDGLSSAGPDSLSSARTDKPDGAAEDSAMP